MAVGAEQPDQGANNQRGEISLVAWISRLEVFGANFMLLTACCSGQRINAAQLTRTPTSEMPAFGDPDARRSSEPP